MLDLLQFLVCFLFHLFQPEESQSQWKVNPLSLMWQTLSKNKNPSAQCFLVLFPILPCLSLWCLRCCHVSSRGPHSERCLFCGAYGSISESTRRRVTGCMYSKIHLISFQKPHCSLAEATPSKRVKSTYFFSSLILRSTSNTADMFWVLLIEELNPISLFQLIWKRVSDKHRMWNVNAECSFGSIGASNSHNLNSLLQ